MSTDPSSPADAVRARFDALARDPAGETRFAVGAASARALGYGDAALAAFASAAAAFAGVGDPLAGFAPAFGARVLDVGCGAGLDLLRAAAAVGELGRAVGVDVVPAMAIRARLAANSAGLTARATVVVADAAALPFAPAAFDVVASNGAINLCVDKPAVLRELARVLRPGGELRLCDMLVDPGADPGAVARAGAWSD
ncbi:MAG: methyltransferase domain-containing protein [Planctomycetota bacterium]